MSYGSARHTPQQRGLYTRDMTGPGGIEKWAAADRDGDEVITVYVKAGADREAAMRALADLLNAVDPGPRLRLG